jgi:hypothetical protein
MGIFRQFRLENRVKYAQLPVNAFSPSLHPDLKAMIRGSSAASQPHMLCGAMAPFLIASTDVTTRIA